VCAFPICGYRTPTTTSWIALGGGSVSKETIQITRNPTGNPKMADAIVCVPNQETP
jgi:hypothetical protein